MAEEPTTLITSSMFIRKGEVVQRTTSKIREGFYVPSIEEREVIHTVSVIVGQ